MSHYISCPCGHGDDAFDVDNGCPQCNAEDAIHELDTARLDFLEKHPTLFCYDEEDQDYYWWDNGNPVAQKAPTLRAAIDKAMEAANQPR